jgi:hypothetical protein
MAGATLAAMPHRPIVIIVALLFAVGIPLYFVVIKRHAASTLEDLLSQRFKPRACPVVGPVEVPDGGRVTCQSAYDDNDNSGLVLVLGSWDRGTVRTPTTITSVQNRVAGAFKASADTAWLERVRTQPDVIIATASSGGSLVVWKGLPSRDSVLAHLEAAK